MSRYVYDYLQISQQLTPAVPNGTFSARGDQTIPDKYLSSIPSIAFSVPDIDSQATMQLKAVDGGQDLACITSQVSNGQSLSTAGVQYIAVGIAGAALALSGVSALASAGSTGAPTSSPTFGDVIGWFQAMALNGMMSADVPGVYRSWSKNFAFSTGLIYWDGMQQSIDGFREKTGGNLTTNSVEFLKNATLVHVDQKVTLTKRSLGMDNILLFARDDLNTNLNGTGGEEDSKIIHTVKGIQGFVEEYTIPDGNAFMTVLLIFAIVLASITVGILLFKVILETWALFGSFPKKLTGFRKRYWWTLAKTITNLILLLYGVWVLYCVYQFKNGDSWAAKTLAGVTLAAFTGVLVFFTWKIWSIANKFKKLEGQPDALYDNKEIWRKYSIFYENYKKSYWWLFIPAIVYMFARGCVIAGADGHGLAQAAGQLIVEAMLLLVLLWSRPYSLKSGNWIHIVIQVVRVLSVVCILVFVEELGMSQTTKTVTGLVLVVVQASLTGVLAILIAVNAIIICCKENPHRKKRKEAGKFDNAPRKERSLIRSQRKHATLTISLPSTHATHSSWTRRSTTTSAAPSLFPSDLALVATIRCHLQSKTLLTTEPIHSAIQATKVSCSPMPPRSAEHLHTPTVSVATGTTALGQYGTPTLMATNQLATPPQTPHGSLNNHEGTRAVTHTRIYNTQTTSPIVQSPAHERFAGCVYRSFVRLSS